ncbi:hypothetical protein HU200_024769 [Digitaria exilis]|uniref:Uncharacterized protein n=1 Tax=Digitaria exilis TaxID=1010633 RepID=A0A835C526_9POAL|nr:hypothetical protein HU200_024769 [Digitaria exilis]
MDVQYHEEYVRNPRGVQLFTCGWLPASSSPKALVFLCHGYGMECSDFMRETKEGQDTHGWSKRRNDVSVSLTPAVSSTYRI